MERFFSVLFSGHDQQTTGSLEVFLRVVHLTVLYKVLCHTDFYSGSWQVQVKQERHQVTLKAVIVITKCNRRSLEVAQV